MTNNKNLNLRHFSLQRGAQGRMWQQFSKMENVTERVKKNQCSMTIIDKTKSNGLKQQEDWSNVTGTYLISRNGWRTNWAVWGSVRFFKNTAEENLPVSITDMPYGRGLALADPAKSLPDTWICSALNWTYLSELFGAQQQLVPRVVVALRAGSVIAWQCRLHDGNPQREALGWRVKRGAIHQKWHKSMKLPSLFKTNHSQVVSSHPAWSMSYHFENLAFQPKLLVIGLFFPLQGPKVKPFTSTPQWHQWMLREMLCSGRKADSNTQPAAMQGHTLCYCCWSWKQSVSESYWKTVLGGEWECSLV